MSNRIIYWFRNDLRLNDNEAFRNAVSDAEEIIPVYVFDPRRFRFRDPGFRKTGPGRARHILEAVANLQDRMREKGGELLIRVGEPEKIIAELANQHNVSEVRASKEITLEETNIEASLSKKLKGINVDISLTWMSTLIHPHDLPVYISRLPDRFSDFAGMVRTVGIREPVPEIAEIHVMPGENNIALPDLKELGFEESEWQDGETLCDSCRGEREIQELLSSGEADTGDLLNWISAGLISPREAYHGTRGSAREEALYSRLLWRDYLLFVALRYGSRLFKPSGLFHRIDKRWKYDRDLFNRWREGETPDPEVNGYLKELRTSGTLDFEKSARAARYLADVLGVNWTWGAAWFESQLRNYEVALHWGNWNYFAGVGPEVTGEAAG